jgi:hypothetical protein
MNAIFRKLLMASMVISAVTGAGANSAGANDRPNSQVATCSSGNIASGTYYGLVVTGNCTVAAGTTVAVQGDLVLAPGATFNAFSMSTVTVSGDVRVGSGATLWLGCTLTSIPGGGATPCTGKTNDVVEGSIVADHPFTMYLDGDTIWGNLISAGGGPGVTESPYVDFPIKDNVIRGNVSVTGWQGAWFGYIRNASFGNVVLAGITGADPDSTEVVTNAVAGNLICLANLPAPQVGDSGGFPNFVGGHKTGQCSGLY